MPHTLKEIRELVFALPPNQRLLLADEIYESVDAEDAEDEAEVATAWDDEIKRRLDEIDSGKVQLLSYEEVRADMDAHIAAKRRAAQLG